MTILGGRGSAAHRECGCLVGRYLSQIRTGTPAASGWLHFPEQPASAVLARATATRCTGSCEEGATKADATSAGTGDGGGSSTDRKWIAGLAI